MTRGLHYTCHTALSGATHLPCFESIGLQNQAPNLPPTSNVLITTPYNDSLPTLIIIVFTQAAPFFTTSARPARSPPASLSCTSAGAFLAKSKRKIPADARSKRDTHLESDSLAQPLRRSEPKRRRAKGTADCQLASASTPLAGIPTLWSTSESETRRLTE
ncbi:hypothetical protein B0H10DRAFT_1957447 [Mycena sp. CBHHK59/15]|nr:hypothetical protein B0H10DRAFT_1957447 [Mycena sp. CBHHK59/15]